MKQIERSPFQKARMIREIEGCKVAIMNSKDLDSTCWSVQFWGVVHCKTCEFLGTEECGGSKEVKEYLRRKSCTAQKLKRN
jgi:hypothetical protein